MHPTCGEKKIAPWPKATQLSRIAVLTYTPFGDLCNFTKKKKDKAVVLLVQGPQARQVVTLVGLQVCLPSRVDAEAQSLWREAGSGPCGGPS